MINKPYHSFSVENTLKDVNSELVGLSSSNAEIRLENDGPNELPQKSKKNVLTLILKELVNPIILLLLFAIVMSFITGDIIEACAIIALVVIDIVIGVVQEKRAEKIASSLLNMVKTTVKVLRNGEKTLILAKNVVVGDIIMLESGDKIPADARIITCSNLKVDESLLTGESTYVEKTNLECPENSILGERKSMLFAGSSIMTGRATAVVVGTGINTEIGKIANTLNTVKDEKSPLTLRINKFSKQITFGICAIAVVIFLLLYFQGNEISTIFLFVIAMVVSAIPEGLPLAVTMSLSIASNKMGKKNVVVKNLNAVESLGSCTVIASDKTGTLTLNQQTAKVIVLSNGETFEVTGSGYNDVGEVIPKKNADINKANKIIFNGLLNNEAKLYKRDNEFKNFGDSIDIAFLALAMKAKVDKSNANLLFQIPYESEKKFSSVFYEKEGKTYCTVKGSIEKVMSFCKNMEGKDGTLVDISPTKLNKLHEKYAKQGYRLIAVACGEYKGQASENNIKNLTFLGFVGFIDPIRLETKPAIENCHNAGIKVLMITGDHPLTAFSIAREIGICDDYDYVATGQEVQEYWNKGKKEFDKFIKTKKVFSRVTPTDKLNIVESLKRLGEFVAVTGDGVNDAPAIKTAHIGIAMGSGTDVAKETSDMIITDDNFSSIVHGIKEGRTAYSNIRKVTYLLLSEGIAELLFFFVSILCGLPIPLVAIQLLYLNVITNGLQDFALSFEKGEDGIMKEKPRSTKESLFSRSLIRECLISGLTIGLVVFAVWIYLNKCTTLDIVYQRSIVMALMVFMQNYHTFNCRSETKSVFSMHFFTNWLVFISVFSAIVLQIIIMSIPALACMLQLTPISFVHFLSVFVLASVILLVMELYKYFVRKYRKKHNILSAY